VYVTKLLTYVYRWLRSWKWTAVGNMNQQGLWAYLSNYSLCLCLLIPFFEKSSLAQGLTWPQLRKNFSKDLVSTSDKTGKS